MRQIKCKKIVSAILLLLAVSCSSNNGNQKQDVLSNDSVINAQLRMLVDSTLSHYIQLKLDSFCSTHSYRIADTVYSISGKGFSRLYRELFDISGSYRVSQQIPSCICLNVLHKHLGKVFEMHDTIVTSQVDTLIFSKQVDEYNKLQDELWQERNDLATNAYANLTKVHFGISKDEYNNYGEDFQRNFYEGLVGYGTYELAKPIFDKNELFVGFEIREKKDETFSYNNVQNNADLIRNEQLGYDAHECFRWVYVCSLYNMEIMSRYDKFDRSTKNSLKCYWNEWVRVFR